MIRTVIKVDRFPQGPVVYQRLVKGAESTTALIYIYAFMHNMFDTLGIGDQIAN